jgi:hypothetical protein
MDDYAALQPVIPTAEKQSTTRQRAHLRLWPIVLGLFLAPLPGAAILTWLLYLVIQFDQGDDGVRWYQLAISMLSPSLWSLVCGFAYLQTISRFRHRIARHECLLLGCGSAFLMPFGMALIGILVFSDQLAGASWNDLSGFLIAGLFSLPFGLFGGWVFWRLGVRPATAPTGDFAAVFD